MVEGFVPRDYGNRKVQNTGLQLITDNGLISSYQSYLVTTTRLQRRSFVVRLATLISVFLEQRF